MRSLLGLSVLLSLGACHRMPSEVPAHRIGGCTIYEVQDKNTPGKVVVVADSNCTCYVGK